MEILLDYFYIEFYELFEGWILSTFILEGQRKKKEEFSFRETFEQSAIWKYEWNYCLIKSEYLSYLTLGQCCFIKLINFKFLLNFKKLR